MIGGLGLGRRHLIAVVALALVCALPASLALAATPPHVATATQTDTCSMCHRAHTGFASFGRISPDSWEMTSNALAILPGMWEPTPDGGADLPLDAGDTPLCYVCHGIDALGSGIEVQSSFETSSVHTLAPEASPYGPSVKYCSSCHDTHGADKTPSGDPYPALLRAQTADGTRVFSAEEYCATCHPDRPLDRFDGIDIYRATTHYSALPDPNDGTKVRCLNCHVGHGSDIGPLITSTIETPAVDVPVPVTANDRTFCIACHDVAQATYPGPTLYATSAHATSDATVAITGEWPEPGASRLVGECQVCHAPMGRAGADGKVIPKLADAAGAELCLRCHDADGPAETDLTEATVTAGNFELLAAYSPAAPTAELGVLQLFASEAGAPAPRPLNAAREYRTEDGLIGPVAVGDLDGDGTANVVVVDPGREQVTVFSPDPLKGLSAYPGVLDVPGVDAQHAIIANVFADNSGQPELVLIDEGQLFVYRYNDTLGADLQPILSATTPVGATTSGIAAGQLNGSGGVELVVTDAAGTFRVLTGTAGETFTVQLTATGKPGIGGPSIGDVWPASAGAEVAIANGEDPVTSGVSVYSAGGALLATLACDADVDARASATLIADVTSGSGAELLVALDGGTGLSSFNVFEQTGSGLAAPTRYDTGTGFATTSLVVGDLDGDGNSELVVGNAGSWVSDGDLSTAPSVQVYTYDATRPGEEFQTEISPRWAGGVEYAGAAPALAIADLGAISASRHPVDAGDASHSSTETADFARHVTCADCHNSHEATSTPTVADAVAPAVYGLLKGVFGTTPTPLTPVQYEYQVCLKCHSAESDLEGGRDIAAEIDAASDSVHAIVEPGSATARADTFENGWSADTILYCADCHGSADAAAAGVAGPHVSSAAPLLKAPYVGVSPKDPALAETLMCYDCHKEGVYLTGAQDAGTAASWFGGTTANTKLHNKHVAVQGFSCGACHVSHGAPNQLHLLRAGVGYTALADGGTCTNACHVAEPTTRTYAW